MLCPGTDSVRFPAALSPMPCMEPRVHFLTALPRAATRTPVESLPQTCRRGLPNRRNAGFREERQARHWATSRSSWPAPRAHADAADQMSVDDDGEPAGQVDALALGRDGELEVDALGNMPGGLAVRGRRHRPSSETNRSTARRLRPSGRRRAGDRRHRRRRCIAAPPISSAFAIAGVEDLHRSFAGESERG